MTLWLKNSGMTVLVKILGQIIFIASCFGLWHFWNLNTSVYAPGSTDYVGTLPVHIPGKRVENVGLLNQRSNGLMISGIGVIVGTLFMLLPRSDSH
jgi:hypothetical protein